MARGPSITFDGLPHVTYSVLHKLAHAVFPHRAAVLADKVGIRLLAFARAASLMLRRPGARHREMVAILLPPTIALKRKLRGRKFKITRKISVLTQFFQPETWNVSC